jgi:hypothetical protein
MEVSIIAGRRGEASVGGRVVARIGQWDARAFPDGGWDGSCECEWYKGNDAEAFERLAAAGIEVSLRLYDYNEACYETQAFVKPMGASTIIGDVVELELSIMGTIPIRRA